MYTPPLLHSLAKVGGCTNAIKQEEAQPMLRLRSASVQSFESVPSTNLKAINISTRRNHVCILS